MTMHEETMPVTLVNGPHDGMELCVLPSDNEVRRPIGKKMSALYIRTGSKQFHFAGYLD
jgi:hypothetical protein